MTCHWSTIKDFNQCYSSVMIVSLYEISYKIDEDIHDSSKVSDDSCGGEEQTIGHNLQVEFDAHKDHKYILPNLKQRARV